MIPGKNGNIFKKLREYRWSMVSSCTTNLSNLVFIHAFSLGGFMLLGNISLNLEGLEYFVQTLEEISTQNGPPKMN